MSTPTTDTPHVEDHSKEGQDKNKKKTRIPWGWIIAAILVPIIIWALWSHSNSSTPAAPVVTVDTTKHATPPAPPATPSPSVTPTPAPAGPIASAPVQALPDSLMIPISADCTVGRATKGKNAWMFETSDGRTFAMAAKGATYRMEKVGNYMRITQVF